MSVIKNPERKRQHDLSLAVELQLRIDRGISFYVPSYFEGLPDIIEDVDTMRSLESSRPSRRRYSRRAVDVKTVGDNSNITMGLDKLQRWTEDDFQQFLLAIWTPNGRSEMAGEDALERCSVRTSKYGTEVAVISTAGLTFTNPFNPDVPIPSPQPHRHSHQETRNLLAELTGEKTPWAGEKTPPPLQLSLDGRQVERSHVGKMGDQRREIIRVLTYRSAGLTSTEVGVLMHLLAGCPEYQKEDRYHTAYQGGACCRKAVDWGSDLMMKMRRQGIVHKDGKRWKLIPENWEGSLFTDNGYPLPKREGR